MNHDIKSPMVGSRHEGCVSKRKESGLGRAPSRKGRVRSVMSGGNVGDHL